MIVENPPFANSPIGFIFKLLPISQFLKEEFETIRTVVICVRAKPIYLGFDTICDF